MGLLAMASPVRIEIPAG